jgi:hypothetical protein
MLLWYDTTVLKETMSDLIEALQILLKYGNPKYPTNCEHDTLMINKIWPEDVSDEDKKRLEELGFFVSDAYGEEIFMSYKFGS